jgi:outer membrane protein assembly factor BamB
MICGLALVILLAVPRALTAQNVAVITHHYDNLRTGWNKNETILTPANVASSSFGVLYTVTLDAQVDAQPLIVPNEQITAGNYQGQHNVVYVATEGNTVYAIDANSGTLLLNPNFGSPVPTPIGCPTNPVVGIESTPVIDLASNTMYVMIYTSESSGPVYTLHALNLSNLTDAIPPVVVTASHSLSNGSTYNFNAVVERQRPALLLANGNVYAAFGSFCDGGVSQSRGWLLGWQASTLTPLAGSELFDSQASDADNFFLSSVWMSGAGMAEDVSGNLFLVTGNSDPSGTTYDGVTDLQESVLKISPDLTEILDLFTPSDWGLLDQNDYELGAGGVMLLPPAPVTTLPKQSTPSMAVAAGKDGNMYLMNQNNLGGYDASNNNVLGVFPIGTCFCGASYYVDPTDLTPRVVTSGGASVGIWKVESGPVPTLTNVANSSALFKRNHGFFTTVSSNLTMDPIIWVLGRTTFLTAGLEIYAFNPDAGGSTLEPIFSSENIGTWPYNGNANLIPVVANGQVYVASGQLLTVLGLSAGSRPRRPHVPPNLPAR